MYALFHLHPCGHTAKFSRLNSASFFVISLFSFLDISGKQNRSFFVDHCQKAELFIVPSLPAVVRKQCFFPCLMCAAAAA
jgi:hypothetical protein